MRKIVNTMYMSLDGDITTMQRWRGDAKAEHLLYRDGPQTRFDLVGTDVHSTGMILLTYRPRPA